jgi:hypothetical protein
MRNTIKETYDSPCTGTVVMGYRNRTTNVFSPFLTQKNLIMYGAADVMARLISGDSRYAISHMYYHYINTSSNPLPSPIGSRADGINFFENINGSTEDWLRIPILTSAKIDKYYDYNVSGTYNDVYSGNMATFVASSASHPTQTGESNTDPLNYFGNSGPNGPSKIIGVALACSPEPQNKYADIVFSRLSLNSPITVQENSYIDCFWSIAFK